MDVALLRVKSRSAPGLKPSSLGEHERTFTRWDIGTVDMTNVSSLLIASALEEVLKQPVIDETGLDGSYDASLRWSETAGFDEPAANRSGLNKALAEQLGLELVPTNMPIEMLVVEKVK